MPIYAPDGSFAHPADIEAEITFVSSEAGGRNTLARTRYSPQFHYRGDDWAAVHEYPDVEGAAPGDTVRVLLRFLRPEEHVGHIRVGTEFAIREGARIVGHGRVTRLLHLPESAKAASPT
jgi:translation elongation factor EF-Tu-like GTPase